MNQQKYFKCFISLGAGAVVAITLTITTHMWLLFFQSKFFYFIIIINVHIKKPSEDVNNSPENKFV
jgi:hypothetical protein